MVPHIRIEELLTRIVEDPNDEEGEVRIAVTAVPDPDKGRTTDRAAQAAAKSVDEILKELCKTDIPNLWLPSADSFIEVPEIPVLGTGKLDLKAVKELALAKTAKCAPAQPAAPLVLFARPNVDLRGTLGGAAAAADENLRARTSRRRPAHLRASQTPGVDVAPPEVGVVGQQADRWPDRSAGSRASRRASRASAANRLSRDPRTSGRRRDCHSPRPAVVARRGISGPRLDRWGTSKGCGPCGCLSSGRRGRWRTSGTRAQAGNLCAGSRRCFAQSAAPVMSSFAFFGP